MERGKRAAPVTVLDDPDVFELLMRTICPTAPYKNGAGLLLCAIARVCRTWRDGVAAKLSRCLGSGRHRRLAIFDVLPEEPACAADLPAYYARLKRVRDHFLVCFLSGGKPVWLELQMDCTHRNVVVQAFASNDEKSQYCGMMPSCSIVESFHAKRGLQKKNIIRTSHLGPPRVEHPEFVGQVIDQLILGVMLHKQALGPPLEPKNYGGVWTFPSEDVAPPCPLGPLSGVRAHPRRSRCPIEVPDQKYADDRGNVVFSCLYSTVAKIPRTPVAAVVPSVDIHFLPRPHWSDRKLRELLEKMQSFPSLQGARPYLISDGGIELPQSAEQRTAFGTTSAVFSEKDVAHLRGFAMSSRYTGHVDEWRAHLQDDRPLLGWLKHERGICDGRSNSQICPSMHVWAKCGPTLQQMRDVMSALEACGHLLIATNLTRVGPFQFKAQKFFTNNELHAMTAHVSTLNF